MLNKLFKLTQIFAALATLLIISHWWQVVLWLNPIDNRTLQQTDIVLYSTSWCSYCSKTRRFLHAADIPFTEHDIEKSQQAYQQYQAIGVQGVPVVHIGSTVVQGFDRAAIRQAIDQLVDSRHPKQTLLR